MNEFRFLGELAAKLNATAANSRLKIPIGDDAAEVAVNGGRVLFATDLLLDGTHFDLTDCGGELAGRKALAVNLSDMAAMAATPMAAVISLALPRSGGHALAEAVMKGISSLAAEFNVAVAGGDTNVWRGEAPFAVNVAIIGEAHPAGSVTRAGARPGDAIFVTGPLGGAMFGRHLQFLPRVELAARLHAAYSIHAMIDLSDGLAGDLRHILAASRVAAVLEQALIPVHADTERYDLPQESESRRLMALTHGLCDGEDFELCFTLPEARATRLEHDFAKERGQPGVPIRIGRIVEKKSSAALWWSTGEEITLQGYEHGLG